MAPTRTFVDPDSLLARTAQEVLAAHAGGRGPTDEVTECPSCGNRLPCPAGQAAAEVVTAAGLAEESGLIAASRQGLGEPAADEPAGTEYRPRRAARDDDASPSAGPDPGAKEGSFPSTATAPAEEDVPGRSAAGGAVADEAEVLAEALPPNWRQNRPLDAPEFIPARPVQPRVAGATGQNTAPRFPGRAVPPVDPASPPVDPASHVPEPAVSHVGPSAQTAEPHAPLPGLPGERPPSGLSAHRGDEPSGLRDRPAPQAGNEPADPPGPAPSAPAPASREPSGLPARPAPENSAPSRPTGGPGLGNSSARFGGAGPEQNAAPRAALSPHPILAEAAGPGRVNRPPSAGRPAPVAPGGTAPRAPRPKLEAPDMGQLNKPFTDKDDSGPPDPPER